MLNELMQVRNTLDAAAQGVATPEDLVAALEVVEALIAANTPEVEADDATEV